MNASLSCNNLSKSFREGPHALTILDNVNFSVSTGELVAIVGPSGSGKSTLLHLLGGLENPTSGNVLWGEQDIQSLKESRKSHLRNQHLGFVYQFHHLLPEFTAVENVAMPLVIRNTPPKIALARAAELLDAVGLADRRGHKITEMSGGERQRTAVARALVTEPACVLADEPTGNLDDQTASIVFDLMMQLQKNLGTSFVLVTHDTRLASQAERIYKLEGGCLNIVE